GTSLRQFKGVLEYPVDTMAGHHGFLNHHFTLGTLEHGAADAGIFPFGVLAHDIEIDIAGNSARQRALDTRQQAAGPQIDVLVELTTELEQRTPQRDMVRDLFRPADGAIEDGVEVDPDVASVFRQHFAVL